MIWKFRPELHSAGAPAARRLSALQAVTREARLGSPAACRLLRVASAVGKQPLALLVSLLLLATMCQPLPAVSADDTHPAATGAEIDAVMKMGVDMTGITGEALSLILHTKPDQAKAKLTQAYNEGKKSKKIDPEVTYMLAAINAHEEKYDQSAKFLEETQNGNAKNDNNSMRSQLFIAKRLGDCRYRDHDLKTALNHYNVAFFLAEKQKSLPPVVVSEILESIVGCETYLKQYPEAEKHCRELINAAQAQVASGGIPAYLNYSWALVQLSEILKKAGKTNEYEEAKAASQSMIGRLMQVRMLADKSGLLPSFEEMFRMFRLEYVKGLSPKTPAEILWAATDFRIKTLPVIMWKPASEPTAAIICIHGLGLGNHNFTNTAKRLADRGYAVVALDVRGFGAWVQTKGEEELDYDGCLADIKDLVALVKKKNPGLPVFILGESMGGAIALRAGAQLGNEIHGVISSVPSAERFQQKRMSLQTALHFIADPQKPMDVGGYVAERATSQEGMRDEWQRDPNARLELSPMELIKFAVFMRTTKRYAGEIKDTPVLMLQGLKDRLVKPKGTFELFEAVNSPDKSIIVQGLSEHLMFENPNPDMTVIDAVDSWLRQHRTATPSHAN